MHTSMIVLYHLGICSLAALVEIILKCVQHYSKEREARKKKLKKEREKKQ